MTGLGTAVPVAGENLDVAAVAQLLARLLGERAAEFDLSLANDKASRSDWFEIEAQHSRVRVTGPTPIAVGRGVYHYLRTTGSGMFTWSGKRIDLPRRLPDFPRVRVESPYALRYYLNACTFGYSTAFWDWTRWEREIDWMALHGINMPLAHVGQEEIWRRVWRHFGVSDEGLDQYFTGPAHLPWHRMGNINHHDGPIPAAWYGRQVELQHRILLRMRELGMHPIAPAFAGFVPPALKQTRPDLRILEASAWAGFDEACHTYMLHPQCELFREIGTKFLQEYTAEFGAMDYYLIDPLNEVELARMNGGRERFLRVLAESISDTLLQFRPEATWVMQGWMFHFQRKFWTRRAVQAFLAGVPDEQMIVIDLCNELFDGWRKLDRFFGKRWMYGVVHNFGGNNPLNGDVRFYSRQPAKALAAGGDRQVGFAICPEGIENNELVYELLTDVAWQATPLRPGSWISSYCRARYGRCTRQMKQAYQLILRAVYSGFHTNIRHAMQCRPSLQPRSRVIAHPQLREAVDALLDCAPDYDRCQFYRQDVTELLAHYLACRVDERLVHAMRAHTAGESVYRDACADQALALMREIDALIDTHPLMRLEPWLSAARGTGHTPEESNYYERNARLLITRWGGPALSEYSSRMWSGLIRDYYLPRWQQFFGALQVGTTADIRVFEQQWIQATMTSAAGSPDNSVSKMRRLLSEVDSWQWQEIAHQNTGDCIGEWTQQVLNGGTAELRFHVSEFIAGGGTHHVLFHVPTGMSDLHVASVRLFENGVQIAEYPEEGCARTAAPHVAALHIRARKPGTDYVISAAVSAADGHRACGGSVWLQAPTEQEYTRPQPVAVS